MKPFSKSELIGIVVIFLILIGISIPNFIASLRKARDQVRKDDMGALIENIGAYFADYRFFPASTDDGRIVACKAPGDVVKIDKMGHLIVNFIPCDWGKDAIVGFMPGMEKTYMPLLPREPNYQKGVAYKYISDGHRMQIFVALESKDDPEYDPKIVARGLMCGNVICNAGRAYGCPTDKSIETCAQEAARNNQL